MCTCARVDTQNNFLFSSFSLLLFPPTHTHPHTPSGPLAFLLSRHHSSCYGGICACVSHHVRASVINRTKPYASAAAVRQFCRCFYYSFNFGSFLRRLPHFLRFFYTAFTNCCTFKTFQGKLHGESEFILYAASFEKPQTNVSILPVQLYFIK